MCVPEVCEQVGFHILIYGQLSYHKQVVLSLRAHQGDSRVKTTQELP